MTGELEDRFERRRTHGGRVAHLIAPDARRYASWGTEALCGHPVWDSAHTPDGLPTCKACMRRARSQRGGAA
jgi:hypothetical protein